MILKWVYFCILLHDYNLCFNGSCYNVSYYSYNSIWPSIVIHIKGTDTKRPQKTEYMWEIQYAFIWKFMFTTRNSTNVWYQSFMPTFMTY